MVIKGGSRGNAAGLAAHLLRTDENERVTVLELRGVVAEELRAALEDMALIGSGARTRRPLYHASINGAPGEKLGGGQRARMIDRLEREMGFTGQPRAVVEHRKKNRTHVHVVWSRIDLARMTAIPDSHNYRRHESVARELERAFGHEHVQGAHVEREGKKRPRRTPSLAEMHQAERSGLMPREATAQVTEIWNRTDNGRSFAAAIEDAGWILARGDRRDFVLIDAAGGTHSLTRRIEGVKAAAVRTRMADLDAAALPSVDEARARQKERRGLAAQIPAPERAADRARDPFDRRTRARKRRSTSPLPRARYRKQLAFCSTGQSLTRHSSSARPWPHTARCARITTAPRRFSRPAVAPRQSAQRHARAKLCSAFRGARRAATMRRESGNGAAWAMLAEFGGMTSGPAKSSPTLQRASPRRIRTRGIVNELPAPLRPVRLVNLAALEFRAAADAIIRKAMGQIAAGYGRTEDERMNLKRAFAEASVLNALAADM